jgi:hypothetical protein
MKVKLVAAEERIVGYDEMGAIRKELWSDANDATKALEDLVRATYSSTLDVGGMNDALRRLRATSTGAALIRQAEEER